MKLPDFEDPNRVPGPIERLFREDSRMMDIISSKPGQTRTQQTATKLTFLAGLHGADPISPFKDVAAVRGFLLTISPSQRASLGELDDGLLQDVCQLIQKSQTQ